MRISVEVPDHLGRAYKAAVFANGLTIRQSIMAHMDAATRDGYPHAGPLFKCPLCDATILVPHPKC